MPDQEFEPLYSQERALMERIAKQVVGGAMRSVPVLLARHGDTAVLFLAEAELGRAEYRGGLWRTEGFQHANLRGIVEFWLRTRAAHLAASLVKE